MEPEIINTSEFAELFAKAAMNTKRKPLSEAYEKKNKARKVQLKTINMKFMRLSAFINTSLGNVH